MSNFNSTKSTEDLTKRSISKKPEENYSSIRKKNSTMNFVERRKNVSGKSPPNPFMSRLNISSFLDLMMSDKNDQSFIKNRKNPSNDLSSLLINPSKSIKDNVQSTTNVLTLDQTHVLMTSNFESSLTDTICPVCANEIPGLVLQSYTSCSHFSCIDCWQCYVINRIENYEIGYGFSCLTCSTEIPYHKILEIIKQTTDEEYSAKLILRLENFYLERALLQDGNFRRCPNRGCDFGVFLNPDFSSCPKLAKCQLRPTCSSQLCEGYCSQFWKTTAPHDCKYQTQESLEQQPDVIYHHISNLHLSKSENIDKLGIHNSIPLIINDQKRSGSSRNLFTRCFPWRRTGHHDESKFRKIRNDKTKNEGEKSPSKVPITSHTEIDDVASMGSIKTTSSRTKFNYSTEPLQTEGEIKMCPKCHTYVLKMNDGSCNHMVCAVCGCEFCWLCMRQITDMHYLSPSGCTFWGRRQWNVEKRALWQMGTLIGAPLAIGFLAALAIPAMLIGIPLYVGRKIHGALKTKNKLRKRTIAVAGGIGAFIVSPVIAAVAVGLGVPLILAYVYVVMPIALCRASACSCDENNPPQEEVDFSDVDNNREQHIFDPNSVSSVKADINLSITTHSQVLVSEPLDSPTTSKFRFSLFETKPIPKKSDFDIKLRNSISIPQTNYKSEIIESLSLENLRTCQNRTTGKVKTRYSDPLTRSITGDETANSLQ